MYFLCLGRQIHRQQGTFSVTLLSLLMETKFLSKADAKLNENKHKKKIIITLH